MVIKNAVVKLVIILLCAMSVLFGLRAFSTPAKPHVVIVSQAKDVALIALVQNIENYFYLQTLEARAALTGDAATPAVKANLNMIMQNYNNQIGYIEKPALDAYFVKVSVLPAKGGKTIMVSLTSKNIATYWFDVKKNNGQYKVTDAGFCYQ